MFIMMMWSKRVGNLKRTESQVTGRTRIILGRQDPLQDRVPTPVFLGFPVAQLVKNLPAVHETWVRSLGWQDPLEKGKATHSSILAWRIPYTVQSMGSQRVRHDWVTFTLSLFLYYYIITISTVPSSALAHSRWLGRYVCVTFFCCFFWFKK